MSDFVLFLRKMTNFDFHVVILRAFATGQNETSTGHNETFFVQHRTLSNIMKTIEA